ncbi:hypothetical protein [Flavobacterium muglaense]|uniref:Uncharacterized protein n=1 Tax=Flavobacterium muglaense TaxID=2764716 RepID=A0A923MZ98_9FLAO|nr:hypothetical protein [Flavobacterium muglaense]MBC5836805.1 hypothetical protein [Flavobacterium muglaense]MBC5843245.1 hypothetical protein [Flavobacterium muglaense]
MLTDNEISIINGIYKRIVPSIVLSIQIYTKDIEDRDGYLIGKKKFNQYEWLYINIKNIKPFQLKTFQSMANKKMPNRYIIKISGEITRLIFK